MASNDVDDGVVIQVISEEKGRGLIATKEFKKDETLFKEKPLVSCQFSWNKLYGYKACDHCLEPLETASENAVRLANDSNIVLPHHEVCAARRAFHTKCPGPCGSVYCAQSCQEDAMKSYHRLLCHPPDPGHPLNILDEVWRSAHYPPETSSIMLAARILATIAQSDNPEAMSAEFLTLMHDTANQKEQLVHKMLGDQFVGQLEKLRSVMGLAFATQPTVSAFLTPDGFASLLALIGRNSQGIGTSALAVWVKEVDKLRMRKEERAKVDQLIDAVYDAIDRHSGHFLNNEGAGLYAKQSTINHSCVPNAVVEFPFNRHELVVNATRNIAEGEEVLISYLDECELERSKHSRAKLLAQNYLFNCSCPKCVSQLNEPDVTSDEEMSDEDED